MNSEPLLAIRHLVKSFGGLRALGGISLTIFPGEIVGLVGPNGSGKSTIINVITGLCHADEGEVWFQGRNLVGLAPHQIAQLGVCRTFQTPRLFSKLTVLENVLVGRLFGSTGGAVTPSRTDAMEWLQFVGLAGRANDSVHTLTLEQRKALEIARALACRPRLVLLDEPLAGLNPAEIEAGIDLIFRIRKLGITVVLVEHVMRVVTALADRVIVLNFGAKVAEGAPSDVFNDETVIQAYLGGEYAKRSGC